MLAFEEIWGVKMENRQNIYKDRRVNWLTTVGLAFLLAFGIFGISQMILSPCSRVFASSECPVGSTQVFAENIGIQGGTTSTVTIDVGSPTKNIKVSIPSTATSTLATTNTAQTISAAKTFDDNTILINDATNTNAYTLGGGELLGDYRVNLPVIAQTSTLVTQDLAQILTNKSIDADDNTITDLDNTNIDAAAGIEVSKLATGTANQILVTNSGGANEFTSEITPDQINVDDLIINDNKINTDGEVDFILETNGAVMMTLNASTTVGNNNIYMKEQEFNGSGRVQVGAFDDQVAASSDQVIFTADELMSATNKYVTGLVQVISKHDTAGNKWSTYLLFISGRSSAGSNSVTQITSQTVSGGCPLTFAFDGVTHDFTASNASATLDCDVGANFFGLGAWQD